MATGFLALESRYVIEGMLRFEGGVHVGSGYGSTLTDAEIIRGAFEPNQAFIPGSSLRGVLRSTLERILQAAKPNSTCVLFAPGEGVKCITVNKQRLDDWKKACDDLELPKAQREAEFLDLLTGDGQCDVCKLFGSPWMASKLRIDDCKLDAKRPVAVRHGVGIDRDTETAAPKIKYDFETLDGRPRFHFRMQLENAGQADLALLGILLHEMQHQGIHVGGKKSRGLGLCKIERYSVKYFDRTNLVSFLTTGELAHLSDFETAVLQGAIQAYFQGGANAPAVA